MTSADWRLQLLLRKQADIPVRDQIGSTNANRKYINSKTLSSS